MTSQSLSSLSLGTQIITIAEDVIARLPAGENPYPAIQAKLYQNAHPLPPQSFRTQLYVLSAILSLTSVLLFCSLPIRYRGEKKVWLFRLEARDGVLLVVPHYTASWTLGMAISLSLLQGFVWNAVYFYENKNIDVVVWGLMVWIPPWLSSWITAWSMLVSHSLHSQILVTYFSESLRLRSPDIYGASRHLDSGYSVPAL